MLITSIITLLVVVSVSLVITRIATVALMATGMSRELAQFQARSAFVGVGFTTTESERIMEHAVRRKIIMWLMLVGNAGFIASVSSLIPIFFVNQEQASVSFAARLLLLVSGLAILWAISISKWVDKLLTRATAGALKRWAHLDVWDYPYLLQLSSGYTVSEVKVEPGDWVAGKNLAEVRLGDEGVQILGIRRVDGQYIGAPAGKTYLRKGDTLVIYGLVKHIAELDRRRAGAAGDSAHQRWVEEQSRVVEEQEALVRSRASEGAAEVAKAD